MQEQNEPIHVDLKLTVGLPLTLERGDSKATKFGMPSLGYADVAADEFSNCTGYTQTDVFDDPASVKGPGSSQ